MATTKQIAPRTTEGSILLFFILDTCLSESLGSTKLLNVGRKNVHKEYSEGHALGIRAPETNEYGDKTAAECEHDLAVLVDGSGGVIRSHKDSTDEETAAENLVKPLWF